MASRCFVPLVLIVLAGAAQAAPAPFDLAGPNLEVIVTRGSKVLLGSEVPNLAVGDKLWVKADLPLTQSEHYLMVIAFLSGSTNPPPEDWFYPCKTWTGDCQRNGLAVTVPQGAQQVLVFFAPSTTGDFRTLVGAVRGRPGAFVRASQDLNQAALDRARLQRYLATIRKLDDTDPYKLKEIAPLLARSLGIKVDDKCLDKVPELQAPCLTQGQESLIMNDGHSTSIVEALTASPGADLLLQASATPQAGYGYYSPYISSVVDIARILDSFRTAEYQYIPALSSHSGDRVSLTLNAAPSFHDPKSVLVVALPAVEQPQLPPMHAVDPNEIYCANRSSLVLPVEGAPLVFATDYAHDVTLTLTGKDGKAIDLPAKADGTQGGYVVDTSALQATNLGETVRATLQGYWGFEPYQGPSFQLRNAHAKTWVLAPGDEESLIVGRQDTVHLQADNVSCVDGIMLKDPAGKEIKAEWKAVKPNEVEVKLPLQDAQPGDLTLLVNEYGVAQPSPLSVQAFSDAGHLDSFSIHSGDTKGILIGSRLDKVASLSIGSVVFVPGDLSSQHGSDQLTMVTPDTAASEALKPDHSVPAKVTLKDGRVLKLNASVDTPRPRVTLIDKSVQSSQSSSQSNIQLSNQDELPLDSKLTFSVRAQAPENFARDETIEVATADESFSTLLNLGNGGVQLADSKVAIVTLDPAKAFGPSAYGPLQFRVISNNVMGDWQALASLVRLPVLRELKCPASADAACKLSGSGFFLIDSVSNDPKFSHSSSIPEGFPGSTVTVPRPADGRLYVRLRDDPSVINPVALEVQQLPPTTEEVARAAAATQNAAKSPPPAATQDPPVPPPVATPASSSISSPPMPTQAPAPAANAAPRP